MPDSDGEMGTMMFIRQQTMWCLGDILKGQAEILIFNAGSDHHIYISKDFKYIGHYDTLFGAGSNMFLRKFVNSELKEKLKTTYDNYLSELVLNG